MTFVAVGDVMMLRDPLAADALFVSGFSLLQAASAPGARAALARFRGTWAAVDLASALAAAAAHRVEESPRDPRRCDRRRGVRRAEPAEAARVLAERIGAACVELGEHGAVAAQATSSRTASRRVVRRSGFGAGDAFAAAFLVGLGRGHSLARALRDACETGARAAASATGWPP